jgi:hypothetical protein
MPLCIAQAPAPPRFGFFFGGAAVDSIVRRAQDHRYGGSGPLRRGHLSSPWVVTKLAALALVGRANIPVPTLAIDAGGLGSLQGRDPRPPGDDAAASQRPVRSVRAARPGRAAPDRGDRRGPALLAGFAAPAARADTRRP